MTRIEQLLSDYADTVENTMTGKAAVGVDLDRTMIYSTVSMNLSYPDDTTFLRVAEMHEGKPSSFITSVAYSMLEIINDTSYLIPVTTRTTEQYRRIRIPGMTETNFQPHTAPQYAIVANGGKLLVNGAEDKDWSAYMQNIIADKCAPLNEVMSILGEYKNESWLLKTKVAENLFPYLIIDRAESPSHSLEDITDRMHQLNWSVSLQGRKFYCVPTVMTKGFAFKEIITRLGADYSIATGDSLLDTNMLEVADYALRPAHGELHTNGYTADNLTVTNNRGVLAGEEIVARILSKIYAAK